MPLDLICTSQEHRFLCFFLHYPISSEDGGGRLGQQRGRPGPGVGGGAAVPAGVGWSTGGGAQCGLTSRRVRSGEQWGAARPRQQARAGRQAAGALGTAGARIASCCDEEKACEAQQDLDSRDALAPGSGGVSESATTTAEKPPRLQASDPARRGPVRDSLLSDLGRRIRSAVAGPSAVQGCGGERGRRHRIRCGEGSSVAAGAQIREHGGDAPTPAAEARQPATGPARGGGWLDGGWARFHGRRRQQRGRHLHGSAEDGGGWRVHRRRAGSHGHPAADEAAACKSGLDAAAEVQERGGRPQVRPGPIPLNAARLGAAGRCSSSPRRSQELVTLNEGSPNSHWRAAWRHDGRRGRRATLPARRPAWPRALDAAVL